MESKIRPAIVTVLGHVDHGKTTLLDTIRKSRVASGEAGGITQGIGASVVETSDGKKITFVDTPGHAAFADMRARGAKLADIAILVVASDDGVMPQTKEAIKYIQEAGIPTIVAITKKDLPTANPDRAMSQLTAEGILLEGRGGDIPVIQVSAKKGEGITELLEMINLVAEVNGLEAKKEGEFKGVVIETSKDRGGLLVSLVVHTGTLKIGDTIYTEDKEAKIRGIFDYMGKAVKEVGPGEPAAILGFSSLPNLGSEVTNNKGAVKTQEIKKTVQSDSEKPSIIIKAQNQGVLEAIILGIADKVNLISSGVGDVTESDVFLAKSSSAAILTFATKTAASVKKLSGMEGVTIENFEIIYELFKKIDDLTKINEVIILGKAEILKSFPYDKDKRVAGCRLIEGEISKKSHIILTRGDKKLGEVRVVSLKKAKAEIESINKGEEFGIYFEPQLDFEPRDVLISVSKVVGTTSIN